MRIMYCNRFFKTKEEAEKFKKENGYGVIYSNVPRSRTKKDYIVERDMNWFDSRGFRSIEWYEERPYCVAWNESCED